MSGMKKKFCALHDRVLHVLEKTKSYGIRIINESLYLTAKTHRFNATK